MNELNEAFDGARSSLDGARENLAELVAWAGRWDRTFQEMGLKDRSSRLARARLAAPFVFIVAGAVVLVLLSIFGNSF